jgi:lipoprotein-releasing system permease protein
MNVRGALLLAFRYLGFGAGRTVSNARKSLYGAIAGIGISLIPLVIVLVVADGMIEGITSRLVELSSSHLHVADYTGSSDIARNPEKMEKLAADLFTKNPDGRIVSAVPERQGIGIVIGKKGRSGGTVRAVADGFFSGDASVTKLIDVRSGTLSLSGGRDAVLGEKLASDIGVKTGDTVRLVTMMPGPVGQTFPKFTTFTVKAIVSSGYQELDALWFFIPFRTGCEILSSDSSWSFINVRVTDPFGDIDGAQESVQGAIPDDLSVYTWKDLNRSQFQSFSTTRSLLLFIMLLIVLVASVNVSSALVMLVLERRKEIAILKSTGTRPDEISLSFILAGFLTGLGGIIVGVPAGILCSIHINRIFATVEKVLNAGNRAIAWLMSGNTGNPPGDIHLLDPAYYLQVIPVRLDFFELFLITGGTLVLSVLFSLLPAVRAGREKPLDTLRKV